MLSRFRQRHQGKNSSNPEIRVLQRLRKHAVRDPGALVPYSETAFRFENHKSSQCIVIPLV
jgi:hypothetical protein